MIRILHTGDIHPNNAATFAGRLTIDPKTSQNLALSDLENSLEFLTSQAFRRQANLALLAGDLFDVHKPHPNEIRLIRSFVARLGNMMPVVAIPGNHDMSQNPSDNTALEAIKGMPNVHVQERPSVVRLKIGNQDVDVFCLPYPTKGRLLTQDRMMDKSPEEILAIINNGLASIIRDMLTQRDPRAVTLLLAHGTTRAATVGEQPRSIEHDILIPLEETGRFDYVALGHIHKPQSVAPNAYYCGSLVRQTFGEQNESKGFNLAVVDRTAPQALPVVHYIENPHARTYATLTREDWRRTEHHEGPQTLDPACVWRFKDTLTAEEEQELRPALDRLTRDTPWFQVNIERQEEARSRDAGMSSVLTSEEALLRALDGLPSAEGQDRDALIEKHRTIEQMTS